MEKILSKEYRGAIEQGSKIGTEKRFFHWDLEFPEAFVDLKRSTWRSKDEQGFDAIVGNPPYDVLASQELGYDVSLSIQYFRTNPVYAPAVRGKLNLYKLFVCQAHFLAQRDSFFSFIVPMALLGDAQAAGIRQHILQNAGLTVVESFPQKDDATRRVFPEAKLSTCIFVCKGNGPTEAFQVSTHSAAKISTDSESHLVTRSEVSMFSSKNLTISSCPRRDWEIVTTVLSSELVTRFRHHVRFFQGEINETNEKARGTINTEGRGQRLIRGASVTLFAVREASQGHDLYVVIDRFLQGKSPTSKAHHWKLRRIAYQGNAPQNNFRRIIAAPVASGEFCAYTVNYCTELSSKLPLDLVMVLLNSKILEWWFRLGSSNAHANQYQINELPIPHISAETSMENWHDSFQFESWETVANNLKNECGTPGSMPNSVAQVLQEMSRGIQRIEGARVLKKRSERSRLASESQPIQDAIDKVLFRCYGLSDDDAQYIEKRLQEML